MSILYTFPLSSATNLSTMLTQVKGMTLKMWEKTMMPKKALNKETQKWEKTGEKEERTTYTFLDEFGDKLVFLGGNEYRDFEGEEVAITLDIAYNNFERKTTVSLKTVALVVKKQG